MGNLRYRKICARPFAAARLKNLLSLLGAGERPACGRIGSHHHRRIILPMWFIDGPAISEVIAAGLRPKPIPLEERLRLDNPLEGARPAAERLQEQLDALPTSR